MKDPTFNEAKQLYLEQYASAIVTGGYLKIAVTLLSLVVLGLVLMNLKIVRTLESFKPMVIRIDEIGRAQAVAYESLVYKPEYKETKYFLTRFCQLDSTVQTEEHHQDIFIRQPSPRAGH